MIRLQPWLGVCWDMDGTLLDTEPIHVLAHQDQCKALGLEVTQERIEQNVGLGDIDFYRQLMVEAGQPDPGFAAGLRMALEKEQLLFQRYLRDGVRSKPGVRAFSNYARRLGRPQCLVTSSRRAAARLAMRSEGWQHRLPVRICSEDVRQHKPMPLPYRLASVRLGIAPSNLLVFEDSPAGIRAARTAGCQVIGMAGVLDQNALLAAGAHHVVTDAREVIA